MARTKPPQTRSSTHSSGVATRASSRLARTLGSGEVEAPKGSSEPSRKAKVEPKANLRAISKPKQKEKAKPRSKPKAEHDLEPSRKRVRKSSPEGDTQLQPSEAARTSLLINLPIEVLVEIARYVHPLDLIMLSRVGKFFRNLLMEKRSSRIWQAARENVLELPSCPEEVSESQYAAMLFAKRCSSCGGYAPREMIPVLMIRLCSSCWEEELVEVGRATDPSLVFEISAPVPGQSHTRKSWCLQHEAREVELKFNEINKVGDGGALRKWKEERHKLVAARKLKAEPLSNWLAVRELKRGEHRDELKLINRKEIESRLIKLDWVKADFLCYDRRRREEWDSMMCMTKVLTDKVWEALLPHLLDHLGLNRRQRFARDIDPHYAARGMPVSNWLFALKDQLPAFAQAAPVEGVHRQTKHTSSTSTDIWSVCGTSTTFQLLQATPSVMQLYGWPEYITLMDDNVSDEQSLIDFEERKPRFLQLIADGRRSLEAHLITLIPNNTPLPNFNVPSLIMTLGTGGDAQPISTLPENVQKLLRADIIFTTQPVPILGGVNFYPHSFYYPRSEPTEMIFHSRAHEVAQALLRALGVPDASYLSLKALGDVFRCGRCPSALAGGLSWDDIINHYLELTMYWETANRKRKVRYNKDFVYVFIHDINMESPGRPLVEMATPENARNHKLPYDSSTCLLCEAVGLIKVIQSQVVMNSRAIVDHVRYVHLIEEPEAGVHYRDR